MDDVTAKAFLSGFCSKLNFNTNGCNLIAQKFAKTRQTGIQQKNPRFCRFLETKGRKRPKSSVGKMLWDSQSAAQTANSPAVLVLFFQKELFLTLV